jgi:uncharacterized protein (DUF697 family)
MASALRLAVAGGLVREARALTEVLRDERRQRLVGPILVSGVLADQLAKELSAGARSGAVVASDVVRPGAAAAVRVVAGDPTAEDDALVRAADGHSVPVVVVQLWPQAEWMRPYVLTPFVVECAAGEGFPIADIADRIVAAVEHSASLAADVPVLERSVARNTVRGAVVRAGLLGLPRASAARPMITLEQMRMVSRLLAAEGAEVDEANASRSAGVTTAAVVASGFVLREVARRPRSVVPAPLVDVAVAAGGTWLLARVAQAAGSRLGAR